MNTTKPKIKHAALRKTTETSLFDESISNCVNEVLSNDRNQRHGPCPSPTSSRVRLRTWTDADLEPFRKINANAQVMRYFPQTLSSAESDALVSSIRRHFEQYGFGLWAAEHLETGELMGFCGLSHVRFDPSMIEVGWRFDNRFWHQGLACEAATLALDDAFSRIGLKEVVSFTAEINMPSWRLMERLGMDFCKHFDHPALPEGHILRRHRLYRLLATDWPKQKTL